MHIQHISTYVVCKHTHQILLVNKSYQPGPLKNNRANYQYEDKTTALYIYIYIYILQRYPNF